jgi:predicted SnoaL-like aldol condensation-catalyzing enzyme
LITSSAISVASCARPAATSPWTCGSAAIAPFIGFVKWITGENPDLRVEFKRFIAESDLVAVHSHLIPAKGARGTAVIDIFRLENGKIVEHWDVLQEVPEQAANQNTMF